MDTPEISLYDEVVQKNHDYTIYSWVAQGTVKPIAVDTAEGIYFTDVNGKRYIDFNSQLMNVNVGHGHKRVIQAIKDQADKLAYVYPGMATDIRGKLGEKLAQITPGSLTRTFFGTSGTEATETAMKVARLYTGRQKIVARYRSFHGGGFGAMTVGGDPRRIPNEPSVPWAVHVHDPYRYRCQFCGHQDACTLGCADHVIQTIEFEGPESVAAVIMEGYSGSSGIIAPPNPEYWTRIRDYTRKHGIMLIVDEVMSGFGRTGKWFGIDNYPGIEPDIMAMAKGLTSGYVPLSGTIVSKEISDFFETHPFAVGGTYSAHTLACAAAVACIDVYEEEGLIDNAAAMGNVLSQHLEDLKDEHPSVGDVRGIGLFQVIELVKNRDTKAPMSDFNKPLTEPMKKMNAYMLEKGLFTFVRWNMIFCCPPLIINKAQLDESMSIINEALAIGDQFVE
jgi:taurine--2-oxoglutarate transaminase